MLGLHILRFHSAGNSKSYDQLNISETDRQTATPAIIRSVIGPVYVTFRQQKYTPNEIDT
jgi:hypothetical protein